MKIDQQLINNLKLKNNWQYKLRLEKLKSMTFWGFFINLFDLKNQYVQVVYPNPYTSARPEIVRIRVHRTDKDTRLHRRLGS